MDHDELPDPRTSPESVPLRDLPADPTRRRCCDSAPGLHRGDALDAYVLDALPTPWGVPVLCNARRLAASFTGSYAIASAAQQLEAPIYTPPVDHLLDM